MWSVLTYFSLNASRALRQKGFRVTFVVTETEFIRELNKYDIAWIISSHSLDWIKRQGRGVDKWRELADACEQFHKSGRGLFILADNEVILVTNMLFLPN